MTKSINRIMAFIVLAGASAILHSQTAPPASRGQLLYATHCISCHTSQVHWRNNRLAYDWDSLKLQVRRWQGNAGLQWGEADIAEVSRYLNDSIYHYPQTTDRVGLLNQPGK